jgi:hypothetical protein
MKRLAGLVFVACLFAGCTNAETVSGPQLIELTKHWKEPKVATWYYVGSNSEYHYFRFYDVGGKRTYRVNKEELPMESIYPITKNRKEWRVMPWGPLSIRQEIEQRHSGGT